MLLLEVHDYQINNSIWSLIHIIGMDFSGSITEVSTVIVSELNSEI